MPPRIWLETSTGSDVTSGNHLTFGPSSRLFLPFNLAPFFPLLRLAPLNLLVLLLSLLRLISVDLPLVLLPLL